MECEHTNLIPHRTWDTGFWRWTCSDCYDNVPNQVVTDRMRKAQENRNGRC